MIKYAISLLNHPVSTTIKTLFHIFHDLKMAACYLAIILAFSLLLIYISIYFNILDQIIELNLILSLDKVCPV